MNVGSVGNVGGGGSQPDAGQAAKKTKPPAKSAANSGERANKLAHVRERMRNGYYHSGEVNEAISDKISGIFDQLA